METIPPGVIGQNAQQPADQVNWFAREDVRILHQHTVEQTAKGQRKKCRNVC